MELAVNSWWWNNNAVSIMISRWKKQKHRQTRFAGRYANWPAAWPFRRTSTKSSVANCTSDLIFWPSLTWHHHHHKDHTLMLLLVILSHLALLSSHEDRKYQHTLVQLLLLIFFSPGTVIVNEYKRISTHLGATTTNTFSPGTVIVTWIQETINTPWCYYY